MGSKPRLDKAKFLHAEWKNDTDFRTMVSTTLSLVVTVAFALYNGFLGVCNFSIWHGSICVFYLLLTAVRGIILRGRRRCGQYRTFLVSTVILLLLNLALITPIVLMMRLEKPVNIGLIPAIAMAAYTTYKIIAASVRMFGKKGRGQGGLLLAELRTIRFIDALVSILTLQNTLIMVNSTESGADGMLTLTAISSAAVYLIIVFATVRLLVTGVQSHNKTAQF